MPRPFEPDLGNASEGSATVTADVCVIGAGAWGRAAAWRLGAEGARVAVVDDGERPAAWVAAGMIAPLSEAADGEEPLQALMLAAAQRWPRFVAELESAAERPAGLAATGALMVAARPEHIGVVRHHAERLGRLGHPVAWRPGSELRDLEPGLGPSVSGGLDLVEEGAVDPRLLLGALAVAGDRAGVVTLRGAARELARGPMGRVAGCTLADGRRVVAGVTVLAAGWATGRLANRVPVRPVKGQVLRLAPRPGRDAPIARTVRTPAVYLVPRPGGEVVVGATVEEAADRTVTVGAVHDLLDEAVRVVPDIRELALIEAAAGRRPATPDGLPALGVDPEDGLVWAAGGYRHGILLAPLAADAVARATAGRPPEPALVPCAPTRFASEVACA